MRPDRFAPLPETCAEELLRILQAHDEARALSLAFVGGADRAAALTACAFVAEVASVPAKVSEPMIGLIRLQWWREALDEAFGGGPVRAHPLAQAMRQTLPERVARERLDAVLDALPPFLEGGGGAPLDLLRGTDGVMGALVAEIVSGAEATASTAAEAGAVAALARLVAEPPAPAPSPQIETPRQRAARVADKMRMGAEDEVSRVRAAWPTDASDGLILGALPFALAPAHAAGRSPGPLKARFAMTRMVARGRP